MAMTDRQRAAKARTRKVGKPSTGVPAPPPMASERWQTAEVRWLKEPGTEAVVPADRFDDFSRAFRVASDARQAHAYGIDWRPLLSDDPDAVAAVHADIRAARAAGKREVWEW